MYGGRTAFLCRIYNGKTNFTEEILPLLCFSKVPEHILQPYIKCNSSSSGNISESHWFAYKESHHSLQYDRACFKFLSISLGSLRSIILAVEILQKRLEGQNNGPTHTAKVRPEVPC